MLPRCTCGGLIKPGIVFFGEPLPLRYTWYHKEDLASCDLLIVMGTSLSVEPVSTLVNEVKDCTPRLLINKEAVGPFRFCGMSSCYRDIAFLDDCDAGVKKLCSLLGWEKELEELEQQYTHEATSSGIPMDISLESCSSLHSEHHLRHACSCPSILSNLESIQAVSLATHTKWSESFYPVLPAH